MCTHLFRTIEEVEDLIAAYNDKVRSGPFKNIQLQTALAFSGWGKSLELTRSPLPGGMDYMCSQVEFTTPSCNREPVVSCLIVDVYGVCGGCGRISRPGVGLCRLFEPSPMYVYEILVFTFLGLIMSAALSQAQIIS
jgi:hypothetical protein